MQMVPANIPSLLLNNSKDFILNKEEFKTEQKSKMEKWITFSFELLVLFYLQKMSAVPSSKYSSP